jgi:hypothetical protein
VLKLCYRLAELMLENDPKAKPKPSSVGWMDAAEKLMRIDERHFEECMAVLEWSQRDEFWKGNVLSMPKFREKYPTLRAQWVQQPAAAECRRGTRVLRRAGGGVRSWPVQERAVKPIFPFYGSKWRDAKRYPPPTHGIVIEPFAGSAGYSLWHAPRKVLLIDADPIIVGVWEYLIGASEAEILALPDLELGQSTDDLRAAAGGTVADRVLAEPGVGLAEEDADRLLPAHRTAAARMERACATADRR